MKYGKLIDGVLTRAPKVLRVDGKTFINPNGKTLEQYGYLPIAEDIMPMAEEGYEVHAVGYEVKDGQIVHVWEQSPIPPKTRAEVEAMRQEAYRVRVDPITAEISRLRDMGGTDSEIAEAMERRAQEVARIKAEMPYPL